MLIRFKARAAAWKPQKKCISCRRGTVNASPGPVAAWNASCAEYIAAAGTMAMDDYEDDMSSVGVTTARIENQQHHQQSHQQGQGQGSGGAVKVGGWRYEDASRYIGEWNQRGQKHGIGHLQFADGTRYDGQFQEGLSQGLGCLWFPDGAKYEGEFHQGWFHGNGIFWRSDGMKYEGEFRGGKIWGLGLLTFQDFTHGFPRNEGYFQDCRFMRRRRCPDVVQRAQKCALMARSQSEHPY